MKIKIIIIIAILIVIKLNAPTEEERIEKQHKDQVNFMGGPEKYNQFMATQREMDLEERRHELEEQAIADRWMREYMAGRK
jgi:hypothetical protein